MDLTIFHSAVRAERKRDERAGVPEEAGLSC